MHSTILCSLRKSQREKPIQNESCVLASKVNDALRRMRFAIENLRRWVASMCAVYVWESSHIIRLEILPFRHCIRPFRRRLHRDASCLKVFYGIFASTFSLFLVYFFVSVLNISAECDRMHSWFSLCEWRLCVCLCLYALVWSCLRPKDAQTDGSVFGCKVECACCSDACQITQSWI